MLFFIYLMFCQWITTTYQTETKCPGSDWIHYAGNCYNLQQTASKTWQEAQTFCSHFNANLVSLTSQEEIDFLNKQGITYVWIGLYKTGTNDAWKWVDKSDVNLILWDVGQPGRIGEDCGVAHSFGRPATYPLIQQFHPLDNSSTKHDGSRPAYHPPSHDP
ncbi:CD209 antigen-like protein A [Physella acuta]|uniref:CD209 antigen-like protein A n=1 Tax=Physella acuta TaxID=109671 RepID=UPI0027DD6C80|nr:CD209 antigen-like protein A [Physella acuta]